MSDTADRPPTGEVVDLDIEGLQDAIEIGVGGFALVFRAFQPAFQRTVAVKIITNKDLDDEARRRFERECQTMGSLSEHPNIVTVYGAGFTDVGRPYLVMAYLPGGSLQDRIDTEGALSWQDATLYGVHLAGALETAHRAQIYHRDIKPGNILMSQYGDAQLTDFGIARVAGGHETRSGALAVSLAHAPPEILEGEKPSNAGDIYSLGSTIFEALTGAPAFAGEDNSLRPLLRRILHDPVPDLRPRGVPDEVCTVIERAMAKDPADRQPSALRFGIELQEARRILGEDPGRLTVPDLRAGGPDDIRFVSAGASPVRSKGASFDLARPGSELLTETTDMSLHRRATDVPGVAAAPARRNRSVLLGAAVAAVGLLAVVGALVFARRPQTVNAGGTPTTEAVTEVTLPPRTVVVAGYTPQTRVRFMDACIQNEQNSRQLCQCVYDEMAQQIPYERFLAIKGLLDGGTPITKTEIQLIVDSCAAKTRGPASGPAGPPPTSG